MIFRGIFVDYTDKCMILGLKAVFFMVLGYF